MVACRSRYSLRTKHNVNGAFNVGVSAGSDFVAADLGATTTFVVGSVLKHWRPYHLSCVCDMDISVKGLFHHVKLIVATIFPLRVS